ncbi:IS3 family transposase [Aggregatibacter actinomycetemcomitans]|uniref:IS3 family transposase n=2 Tax=Aggregatibacter actinomycetemcomitans TaxID=714 RepID=UPI00197C025D|nr:IS3 family transposase [Aggregatibacter actinomycetemcomitans]MBN6086900.1 IS3 family transposase [Aggregatibacter actinomycetemcomitans]
MFGSGERHLKKVQGAGRTKSPTEKRGIVNALKGQHSTPLLLKLIGLPRSTFYYTPKPKEHGDIRQRILALYQQNEGRDGYRMIRIKLRKEGIFLSGKTVLSHMRALEIRSCVKVKRRKNAGKTSHIAPNLLQRNFTATKLKEKWVTDVTELRVGREKLYLSPMMDLANQEIIAFTTGRRPTFGLVSSMLKKTLIQLNETYLPIIHTDQGCLHGLARWRKMLIRDDGLPYAILGMSRRGNCYDNAVIESFFSTLKSACFYSRQFKDIDESERAIHDYIRYYNEERIKPKLNNLSPVQYRAQYLT